jgi:hypothetical protein
MSDDGIQFLDPVLFFVGPEATATRECGAVDPLQRWYSILSEAPRHFLRRRQLQPPLRLQMREGQVQLPNLWLLSWGINRE